METEIQDTGQQTNTEKQTHRSVKVKLKTILRNYNEFYPLIRDVLVRTNQLVIYGNQFLRMFVLEKYTDNMKIDRQFIYNILKTIGTHEQIKYNNDNKYASIFEYYNSNLKRFKFDKINFKNISFVLQYASIEIATCFENNLMCHFKDHLNKYINILFLKNEKAKIKETCLDLKECENKIKELIKDIKNLKYDLYTNSTLVRYDGLHVKWLIDNRNKIVPIFEKNNINYHLKKDPLSILKYSIYINKQIEQLGKRPYQIIPQRNNNVYRHITIDHAGIVDMLGNNLVNTINIQKKKHYIMLHPKECQKDVFDAVFNMKHKIFRQGKHIFNYQFKTDGVSAVLDFVNHRVDKYEKKIVIVTKKITKKEILKNPKNDDDLPELEKLKKNEIKEINTKYKLIGNDPGLKSLMAAVDEKGKVFQYNAVQRRHETYHKFAHKIKQKERKSNGIDKIEETLSKYSCRTMNIEKYFDFVHSKNEVNKKVFNFYDEPKFRNINFRVYCREKSSEANLLNNIEKCFSDDTKKPLLFMYGNFSRSSAMKYFFPTPCKWFRKLISSRFKTILVDEFKTSCICNITEQENIKWKYMVNGKLKECNKVLSSIKDTNPQGKIVNRIFVDRDINGAKNILKIGKSWLNNRTRPSVFCRKQVVGMPLI